MQRFQVSSNSNENSSKSIKSEDNKENLTKSVALYSIIGFCAVFGLIFLLKKRKEKNELQ